jgi:hypothetical protein
MSIIDYLRSFNRKERFFLVGAALDNPDFTIGQDFSGSLSEAFEVAVPEDAFLAMDYHLDWIHASLALADFDDPSRPSYPNDTGIVTGTIEDIDLIVAFERDSVTHIILLEAKAETGWTNKQMASKSSRLIQVFGKDGLKYGSARPHFGLISPRPPRRLDFRDWPEWMAPSGEPHWLTLFVPARRRKLVRCDADGKGSETGAFFKAPTGN